MISLCDVNVRVSGRLFLQHLNWTVNRGEQWAVLGGNGNGKTLLADVLAQRYPLSSGQLTHANDFQPARDIAVVSVEVQDRLCAQDARHDISEFFDSATDPGTQVEQLILNGARQDGRFGQLARSLHIEHLLTQGVRSLSSGEMRKCLLAAALWKAPPLLVLDEPLEGLDPGIREPVARLLEQSVAEGQQIILLSRHAGRLMSLCTHALIIKGGRIHAQGKKDSALVQDAIADIPRDDPLVRPLPAVEKNVSSVEPTKPLVRALDVDCSYGDRQVLFGVNCTISVGQHTSLSGPNGAGKSTLLALICGDNSRAYGQQLEVFGQRRGAGMSIWQLKRHLGIVSNALHRQYPERCRVLDVLLSGFHDSLGLYETASATELRLAKAWLISLGLDKYQQARFGGLSFGDQRLLLIARAVIKNPQLLVLDEPVSGLDSSRKRQVLELIDHIAAQQASTILYVSHEQEDRPQCIIQELRFVAIEDGSFRLR